MKKSIIFLLLAAMVLPMSAQEVLPMTVRNGNTYIVGKDMMNKHAYEGYLKNTCPTAFQQFHTGMVISNWGWGLFGGGLGAHAVCIGLAFAGVKANQTLSTKGSMTISAGTAGLWYAGSCATVAGITCLIVGYVKMHHAADTYNVLINKPEPATTVSLQAGENGIGLALNF